MIFKAGGGYCVWAGGVLLIDSIIIPFKMNGIHDFRAWGGSFVLGWGCVSNTFLL